MLGTYIALGVVTRTPTATVWKGRDTALNRDVALKQVTTTAAAHQLRSEAAVLTDLNHPNIVRVFDLLEVGTDLWLVEQWIDGAPLREVLTTAGALTPIDALTLISGALKGLAHTHSRGIVHGDITASNILIASDSTPMLVDFGLAAPSGLPGVGGTAGYMAPEIARGKAATTQSDVYSCCALLAEIMLGTPLFSGHTAAEVIHKQLAWMPNLDQIVPAVASVLQQGLSVDPAPRPADAAELLALLEEAARHVYGAGWKTTSGLGGLGAAAATIAAGLAITDQAIDGLATSNTPGDGPGTGGMPLADSGTSTAASPIEATAASRTASSNGVQAVSLINTTEPANTAMATTSNAGSGIVGGATGEGLASKPLVSGLSTSKLALIGGLVVAAIAAATVMALVIMPSSNQAPPSDLAAGPADANHPDPNSEQPSDADKSTGTEDANTMGLFSGTYRGDLSVDSASGVVAVTSDCPTCSATAVANGITTVLDYAAPDWINTTSVGAACGTSHITLTPVETVDGYVTTLEHYAYFDGGCIPPISGTLTRIGD